MTKLTFAVAAACVAISLHAEFRAGFARVDVTPPLGIPIPGYFSKRISNGVLDPLCIECVAVSDGTNAALIYSVDDLHLSNKFFEKAFPAITAATGIPRDRIYVHSTHTHTGAADWPRDGFTDEEKSLTMAYAECRIQKLADTGRFALSNMAPATISIARKECKNVSFIRRWRMKDGSVRTNPGFTDPRVVGPLGTPDETLQLVRFRRTGAPDIAIVNFGVHPDTVQGLKYSADWPGVVRNTFENGIGGGVKCLVLNGAQGDVNHFHRSPPPGRVALDKEKKRNPKAYANYMGRAIAGTAMAVWDYCEDVPAGPVNGTVRACPMPTNLPTADEIKWVEMFDAGRKDEIPLGRMEILTLTGKNSRVRKLKDGPDHFDILISSVSIGDSLAFAGLPCEPFVDIGRDVKAQSPFKMTMVSCLTNGAEGYIPSTKAHNEGGYEGLSSRFAAPTGDLMVAAQVEQLKKQCCAGK